MNVELTGVVMDVVSSEYDFEGRKGVVHKVCIYSNGTLYKVGIDESSIKSYVEKVGQSVTLKCKIFIKGTYNLKITK